MKVPIKLVPSFGFLLLLTFYFSYFNFREESVKSNVREPAQSSYQHSEMDWEHKMVLRPGHPPESLTEATRKAYQHEMDTYGTPQNQVPGIVYDRILMGLSLQDRIEILSHDDNFSMVLSYAISHKDLSKVRFLLNTIDICNQPVLGNHFQSRSEPFNNEDGGMRIAEEMVRQIHPNSFKIIQEEVPNFSSCIRPPFLKYLRKIHSRNPGTMKVLGDIFPLMESTPQVPWPEEDVFSAQGNLTSQRNENRMARSRKAIKNSDLPRVFTNCFLDDKGELDSSTESGFNFCYNLYTMLDSVKKVPTQSFSTKKCSMEIHITRDFREKIISNEHQGEVRSTDSNSYFGVSSVSLPVSTNKNSQDGGDKGTSNTVFLSFRRIFDFAEEACPGIIIIEERRINSLNLKSKIEKLHRDHPLTRQQFYAEGQQSGERYLSDLAIVDIYNMEISKFRNQLQCLRGHPKQCDVNQDVKVHKPGSLEIDE